MLATGTEGQGLLVVPEAETVIGGSYTDGGGLVIDSSYDTYYVHSTSYDVSYRRST